MTLCPLAEWIHVAAFPVKETSSENRDELVLSVCLPLVFCGLTESKLPTASKDAQSEQDHDDFTMLKSLADGQKPKEATEVPVKKKDQYVPDESDSTKSRRLVEDYDSTKNGMDYGKYQGMNRHHALTHW